MGKHYRAKIKEESEIYRLYCQQKNEANVRIEKLLEDKKQLEVKLNYFKNLAQRNHEKAQIGQQTLEQILFVHSDLAHKIAKEGLEEIKK